MTRVPKRAWQRMLSGRRLDLLNPSPLDVELADIAHGLARVPRWNGQTEGDYAYSVAQHSIFVTEIAVALKPGLDEAAQLTALLHDAPEYVIGDIISPIKSAIGDAYKALEERLLTAVHLRFSLPGNTPATLARLVKKADREAAYYEAVKLAGFETDEALKYFGTPSIATFDIPDFERLIRPWPTQEAQDRFTAGVEALAA